MVIHSVEKLGSLSQDALDRFVYIIGAPRGGTSILRDAIGLHEHILALPGMTHFMNQVWRYRKKVHPRLLNQIFRLPGFYQPEKVIESLDEERGRELRLYIDRAMASRDLKTMWEVYPIVYALSQGNRKGCKRILCWTDKANDFYKVRRVARAFPRGRFIFVVRDPRGSVSSQAKTMAVAQSKRTDAPLDDEALLEACISWRRMTQRMLHFHRRYPERSLLIRFEEFLASPAAVLNSIFRFILNSPIPEDTLNSRLGSLVYGTTYLSGEQGVGVRSEPGQRWRKVLDDRQVRLIGEQTGRTSEKAGYFIDAPRTGAGISSVFRGSSGVKKKFLLIAKMAYLRMWETMI